MFFFCQLCKVRLGSSLISMIFHYRKIGEKKGNTISMIKLTVVCFTVHTASSKPDSIFYDETNERTRNQKCSCHLSSQSSLRPQTQADCAASKPSIYLELSLSLLAHESFPTSPNLPGAQEKPALPPPLRNVFTFQRRMEYHLAQPASRCSPHHGREYVPPLPLPAPI